MELVGPYEQLHRRLDSLQMRFVRDLSANPWRAEDLIFDDGPWDELQGPEYELDHELHQPIEVMVGMIKARLSLFDTQMMEVISDAQRDAGGTSDAGDDL